MRSNEKGKVDLPVGRKAGSVRDEDGMRRGGRMKGR
jgi:hypothetical protein